MKYYLFVALGLLSAVALLQVPATRRASTAHAAIAPQAEPTPVAPAAVGDPPATAPEQTRKAEDAAAKSPAVVREIDVEGLKKILRRDSAQAAAAAARPLLVNFWATWCVPCREEFPDLVRIDADYKSRGLEFVTVSLDEVAEIKTGVPQFLQKMGAQMPTYLLNVLEPETAIAAVDPSWTGALPATFLFNQRGQIVFKHMGRVKPAELRAAIEKAVTSDK